MTNDRDYTTKTLPTTTTPSSSVYATPSSSSSSFPSFPLPPLEGHSQFHRLWNQWRLQAEGGDTTPSSTSSSSSKARFLNTAHINHGKGLLIHGQRFPLPTLLSPQTLQRLQSLSEEYVETQQRYLTASLLCEEVNHTIENGLRSAAAAATLTPQELDTYQDLDTYWTLVQAESYLTLDGQTHQQQQIEQQQQEQQQQQQLTRNDPEKAFGKEKTIEATLFGLDWTRLSDSFLPKSSLIPSAANSSVGRSHPPSTSHSFTHPHTSSLQSSFDGRILESCTEHLEDRVQQMWNEYDPTGEERQLLEEETAQEAAAGASSTMNGRGIGVTSSVSSLPPLDTSNLVSVLRHRLARIDSARRRLEQVETELVETECRQHEMVLENLRMTMDLLLGHVTRGELLNTTQLTWLTHKVKVIAGKVGKLQSEVLKDTYLGYESSKKLIPPIDHRLILPSLSIIRDTLTSILTSQREEFQRKKLQVEEYQRMGAGFYQIAQEYHAIQRQIENKKWTIQELNAHAGTEQRRR